MTARKPTSIGIDSVSGRPLTCVNYNGRVRLFYQDEPPGPAYISRVLLYRSHADLGRLMFANRIAVQTIIDDPLLREGNDDS